VKKPPQQPVASDPNWRNLRDEDGRLYGRVNRVRMILEIRRNQKTITFDLSELIVVQEKRDIVDSK
jgi:hypothetical protein